MNNDSNINCITNNRIYRNCNSAYRIDSVLFENRKRIKHLNLIILSKNLLFIVQKCRDNSLLDTFGAECCTICS